MFLPFLNVAVAMMLHLPPLLACSFHSMTQHALMLEPVDTSSPTQIEIKMLPEFLDLRAGLHNWFRMLFRTSALACEARGDVRLDCGEARSQ